ncbi:Arf-Gap With Sh3 Domain, Ank Repeat And Ph Domain-Containing Protein 1 [Manis pentadactyla]|nr:Arf-Gap With Sh3 Domain, Ank Repeat And Ph Domain-Containing Protein 1 [Manis pentadactyla]
MGDIKDEGEVSDPVAKSRDSISCKALALRKQLGSGSDVTGKSMHMIRLRREFGFNSDGYVIDKGYGVDRDTFRFASYSDVRAKARFIFIIVLWHR